MAKRSMRKIKPKSSKSKSNSRISVVESDVPVDKILKERMFEKSLKEVSLKSNIPESVVSEMSYIFKTDDTLSGAISAYFVINNNLDPFSLKSGNGVEAIFPIQVDNSIRDSIYRLTQDSSDEFYDEHASSLRNHYYNFYINALKRNAIEYVYYMIPPSMEEMREHHARLIKEYNEERQDLERELDKYLRDMELSEDEYIRLYDIHLDNVQELESHLPPVEIIDHSNFEDLT